MSDKEREEQTYWECEAEEEVVESILLYKGYDYDHDYGLPPLGTLWWCRAP